MASLKQIASDLGVSTATVSNALSGKGRVSEELAEKIRDHASRLGYRPSSAARALKTGQSGILGLVMPDLTNPLFPRIAQNLSIAAEARGLGILIADSRGDAARQDEALAQLVGRGVDGIIIVPRLGTAPPQMDVPMVVINTASDPRNTVAADHRGGGRQLGAHLGELGHRNVVLLGGNRASEVQQDRMRGMTEGLGPEAHTCAVWGEEGMSALPGLVAEGATCVMATSDLLALGAHSHLSRAGLSVPGDVSLTGFDDLPLATAMHPELTTIAQDVEAIADQALDVLTLRIAGRPDPAPVSAIPMRLVLRQSTWPPRRRDLSVTLSSHHSETDPTGAK
ncbi:transcriptional regulator, LacI family [Pseudooceanicola antarcticus]|uniref:LacI family transcriptional regulator n=1 Tax=Pseudooceanicola antarcticus TaxID=1247613 RepID=A0A285HZA5_9RHOB|nr:LacI family DNA-binding transcriptional regulator [Pseudooceanicola antarcticus]PJE30324.1 LacI family transcriptional regulator [Pseudooceanicola antarcticus]SNY41055.1 transcriptional regulator, LacI family [Pseudooceanicola antarcticus]